MNKKTQKKINKIVIISFLTIFMLNLIYYIFVGSKSLMNSDSNLVVDYALEAIKKGTLFPKTWNNTNDFWIYSLIPAIIPLLKLNIPLFLARQIPVFIQSSTLIIITYDLYNRILKNKLGAIIILMIILSGFSGQFMFEVYGDATYGSIIFFMVLELYLIINIYNVKNKKNFLILILLFFLILTFLTSCSLRFPIFITAPLICVIVYRYLVQKCQKKDIYIFIILILSTLIGYYLHNLLISNLLFNVGYGNPLVSSSTELQESINNVLFNILHLSGVSNLNVYSLTFKIHNNFITNDSPLVLIPFIKFLFLCLLIVIPFKIKSRIKYLNNIEEIIFVFSVSFSFILMFFLLFCGFAWWYRYITPMVFVLLLNIPIFFKLYIKDSNYIQPFIIFIIISCLTSFVLVINSFYNIETKQLRVNPNQELANFLNKNNLHYGYRITGDEHGVYNLLSNGDVRISCLSKDGKQPFNWLNSTDWFTSKYTNGKVFFLKNKDDMEYEFEKKSIYTLEYGDLIIYVFESVDDIINQFS